VAAAARPLVSLGRCASYRPAELRPALERLLAPLGGMAAVVRPGQRVLLKPNLVMGRAPEKAVTTHPAVVEAVGELVKDCGGEVLVGDSPGLGSAARAVRASGLEPVVQRLGATIVEFHADETQPRQRRAGPDWGGLDMARERWAADVLVNLPKFKTHVLTTLTLAVKNCFGLVVGPRKFQWHHRAGHNQALFARLLADICRAAAPDLNLLDGVVGMEGEGPTSGTPRPLGLLAASRDAFALDAVGARLAGLEPADLPVLAAAGELPEPALTGATVAELAVSDLRLATPRTAAAMGPRVLRPLLRRWLTGRPAPLPACTGCGACAQLCPAEAIAMRPAAPAARPRPVIDHEACIRCYCCHELCPEHAMGLHRPLPMRLVQRLTRSES
jgi:uncharacterized protein (DUF362 family)/NAD-dependent dihydropyrimidine dehydrogenase PreA subunit